MTRIDELVAPDWPSAVAEQARHARAPELDTEGFSCRRWRDLSGAALERAWDRLAQEAETPNPFFERWYLIPSLEHFDPEGRVRLAMLVESDRLVGLMPLWRDTNYHGHPLPHLASWSHPNMFCGEPLIAPGYAERFWSALLDWCDRHERASFFVHLPCISADSSDLRALHAVCTRSSRSIRTVASERRAALVTGPTPAEHLRRCLEKKRRKELSRKRRRLEELGQLAFTRRSDETGLDPWIDEFLALEKAGWKGNEGSALACDPRTEALFRQSMRDGARQGRLERLAFHLDGRAIAMLCNFIAPPMSFGFKTAYDEDLSKLSPGVLLQVENLALLERPDITLSDSCAAPGHPMIDHIWLDRRTISKVTVSIGGFCRRKVGTALSALEVHRSEKRK